MNHKTVQKDVLYKKAARRALTRLEELKALTPEIRKIVLDTINDLRRDLEDVKN